MRYVQAVAVFEDKGIIAKLMKEYTLPKTGFTARANLLDSADLVDVLSLQDVTRAALPDSMKMFILPQTASYFQGFLMRQTGVMIGIRVDGELVAQMALMGPMELREAILLRAITKNDISFHHAALTDSVIVFKSMSVHPGWRGNDLSKHLVSYALSLPVVQVANHVFAQISAGNRRSWDVFVREGFGIVAAAYDPADNQPRFVFQKPAFGFDFAPAIIAEDVDALEDFSAIVNLTQREALIGVYDQETPGRLSFMRSADALNLMPTVAKVKSGE